MHERSLQRLVIDFIRYHGGYVINNWGTAFSGKGTPDLVVCWMGRFYAFELKHPSKPLMSFAGKAQDINDSFATPAQQRRFHEIRRAGGIAACVNSRDHIIEILMPDPTW